MPPLMASQFLRGECRFSRKNDLTWTPPSNLTTHCVANLLGGENTQDHIKQLLESAHAEKTNVWDSNEARTLYQKTKKIQKESSAQTCCPKSLSDLAHPSLQPLA